jgi:hypothetical protein
MEVVWLTGVATAQSVWRGLLTGWLWFDSWQGQEIFFFLHSIQTGSGGTQPPVQWVPGAFSPGGYAVN